MTGKQKHEASPYYKKSSDSILYCCIGRDRIKVTEHFAPNGKTMEDVIKGLIISTAKEKHLI